MDKVIINEEIADYTTGLDGIKENIKLVKALSKAYEVLEKVATKGLEDVSKAQEQVVKESEQVEKATREVTGTSEKQSKQLEEITKQYTELKKQFDEIAAANKKYTDELKRIREEKVKLSAAEKEAIRQTKQLESLKAKEAQATSTTALEIAKYRLQVQQSNKEVKEQAKEALGLIGPYKQVSNRLVELRKQYKDLVIAQGENAEGAAEMLDEIQDLDSTLKELDASVGQHGRNVGNYAGALQEAGLSAAILGGEAQSAAANIGTYIAMTVRAAKASGNFRKDLRNLVGQLRKTRVSMKALAAGTVIGALLLALGAVQKAFGATADGQLELQLRMARLNATIEVFTARLVHYGDLLISLFDKVSAESRKLLTSARADIEALKGVFGLASEDAEEFAAQYREASEESQDAGRRIRESFKKAFATDIANDISTQTELIKEHHIAMMRLSHLTRQYERDQAKAAGVLGVVAAQADNDLNSLTKREELYIKLAQEQERVAAQRVSQIQTQLSLVEKQIQKQLLLSQGIKLTSNEIRNLINNEQLRGKVNVDLLDQQQQFILADLEARSEHNVAIEELEAKKGVILLDNSDLVIDFLRDGAESQMAVNLALLENEEVVFARRYQILEDTRLMMAESLDAQIAEMQQYTDEVIDVMALINEQDSIAFMESMMQLELPEREFIQLLDTIKTYRDVFLQLDQTQRQVNIDEQNRQIELFQLRRDIEQAEKDAIVEMIALQEGAARRQIQISRERTDAQIDALQFEYDTRRQLIEMTIKDEERKALLLQQLDEETERKRTDMLREGQAERMKLRAEAVAETIDTASQFLGEFNNVVDGIFTRQNNALKNNRERIEQESAAALAQISGDEEERARIERRFAIERERQRVAEARQKRKEAVFEKALSVIGIIGSTAQSVASAIAASPLTGGLPFSAINAALGAAQLAAVIAQPIPQFFKGTKNAPEGPAWVGERGVEAIQRKRTGRIELTPNTATMTYLNAGDKVFTASETRRIVDRMQLEGGITADRASMSPEHRAPIIMNGGITAEDVQLAMNNAVRSLPLQVWGVSDGQLKGMVAKSGKVRSAKQKRNRW